MNGNGITPPEPAPTVESLQAELARARQLIQLFRQQRDQASTLCNDLQVELAMTRQELEEVRQVPQGIGVLPEPEAHAEDEQQP